MDSPNREYFRERYSAMEEEELAELCAKAARRPEDLTEPAKEALRAVVQERRLDITALLLERAREQEADQRLAAAKQAAVADRRTVQSRALGKLMGGLGICTALAVFVASVAQSHLGGIVAAIATAGCSAWYLFLYKRD